ncbi:MAG: hypothetical protein JNL79_11140 [Myxococcales bacterium]|nr:hypothetical protein [Myxococcales bacterium]
MAASLPPIVRPRPPSRLLHGVLEALLTSRWVLVCAIVVGYWAHLHFSERIGHHDGLGDDGVYFAKPALEGLSVVWEKKIDGYYLQRVLPSLLVRGVYRLLHVEVTIPRVVSGFQTENLCLVALSAYLYTRVAQRLAISPFARTAGGLCIFVSFGVAKWTVFDPVLTDLWAFAIGWIYLVAWLERRPWLIASTALVGAFCWPSALQTGVVLLLGLGFGEPVDAGAEPAPFRLHLVVGGLAAALYLRFAWPAIHTYAPPNGPAKPEAWCLIPALLIGAGALGWGLAHLADDRVYYSPSRWVRALLSWPVFLGVGAWWLSTIALRRYSDGSAFIDIRDLWAITAYTSAAKPGVFLLAHVLFFGPLLLVCCLRCASIMGQIRNTGAGAVAVVAMLVVLGLNSESRRLYLLVPFVLPFAIVELERCRLSRRAWGWLVALSAFGSKVWLQIDTDLTRTSSLEGPGQTLFMTSGPWMSWSSYLWQGLFVFAAAFWLHRELHSSEASASPAP